MAPARAGGYDRTHALPGFTRPPLFPSPLLSLRVPGGHRGLLHAAVLAFAILAGGLLFQWITGGGELALLWLPAGIALAALWRFGPALASGALIGSFLLNAVTGTPAARALALALGCTLGPLVATLWLTRARVHPNLERSRDLMSLLAAAALSSLLVIANAAAWSRPAGALGIGIATAWLGAWLASVVVAVPLLTLDHRTIALATSQRRWIASGLALGAVAVSTGVAFGLFGSPGRASNALLFAVPVLGCWLVLRRGVAAASLATALAALVAIAGSVHGPGLFGPAAAVGGLSMLGWYVASLAGLTLLVAALTGDLVRHHERWRLALEGSDLGVAEWDLRTGLGSTSRRWHELIDDHPRGETSLAQWLARLHGDDRARAREAIDALARPGTDGVRQELRVSTPGGWRWFDCQALVAERDASGAPQRLVMSMADISERRGAEERQRLSASLFQHLHEGLLITDAQLRVLDVNPTYSQITGLSRMEVMGKVPALLEPSTTDLAGNIQQATMWASLRAAGTWRGEVVDRRRNGDPCALHVTITAVRGPDEQALNHVLVISDITEQRLQRERLERQAHFDELTRLPNRMRMSQLLAEAMAAAEREGYLLAVCYLDLDHFKPVNDRYGHAAGDRLLVELAQRLRGALRSSGTWSDVAARLGGDEFVLLLRAGTLEEARLAVERVLRVIAMPYAIDATADTVQVTASVGATVYPLDRSDPDTLLRHADHAMYGAKQSGRNGYLIFDPEHSRRAEERVMAIGRVQEALDNHEFVLHYQPKVDMRRGVVLGVEALLRWNHPEHGVIAPLQFLPLIEHTGLSARVGDWVLEQALDQLAHWQRLGLDLSVSVNVSARHLQEPDFAQRVAELLARHTRPLGARLELEVLETAALADVAYTSSLMERCRLLGLRFALDDFGTGYSTLTYLKRLPVDVLKIDRSFVHSMLEDRQDLAIVEGVIGLARTFGCVVIAEGVESPAQARLLIELGCDIGQGLGIAAAMPPTDVFRWVRDYRGPFALTAAPTAATPGDADAASAARVAAPE